MYRYWYSSPRETPGTLHTDRGGPPDQGIFFYFLNKKKARGKKGIVLRDLGDSNRVFSTRVPKKKGHHR